MPASFGSMMFDSWDALLRILVVGTLAYVALVLMLRVSGKRTLSKFNAFDFIVTVALGSMLATVLLSKSVTLADGLLGLALLIGLQYLIAFLSVRSSRFRALVKSEPTLLLHRGEFLDGAMRRERVTRNEVLAVLRSAGVADRTEAAAVVLETDGTLSVLSDAGQPPGKPTLEGVRRS